MNEWVTRADAIEILGVEYKRARPILLRLASKKVGCLIFYKLDDLRMACGIPCIVCKPVKLHLSYEQCVPQSAWPAQARCIADQLPDNPLPLSTEVLRKRLLNDRGWIFADSVLSKSEHELA
jgi:hypothetical protein